MRKRGRPKKNEVETIEQPTVREEDIQILDTGQVFDGSTPFQRGVRDARVEAEKQKKEDFAEKIQSIAVKTEPRTFIETPVTLRVKGENVVRMRKRHMIKG